jgi:hypothetical protein
MKQLELKDVLSYALGGSAPEKFLDHLIRHKACWDEVFWRRIDELAYEFRPDLAVWVLSVDEEGRLHERRLPML